MTCLCGCGGQMRQAASQYLPGHNMRMAGASDRLIGYRFCDLAPEVRQRIARKGGLASVNRYRFPKKAREVVDTGSGAWVWDDTTRTYRPEGQ